MSGTNNKNGLFVGLNKGRTANLPTRSTWKSRPVLKKGKISKRAHAVRQVIREVAGFSPIEKRMMEMIRTEVASKEKKAVKHCRAKFGTHRRALMKRDELVRIIQSQQRKK